VRPSFSGFNNRRKGPKNSRTTAGFQQQQGRQQQREANSVGNTKKE
jgi:hypothetical protein